MITGYYLGQTATFDFVTARGDTGAAATADSTPTAQVFEDANDTPILTPVPALRLGATGNYRMQVALTTANGFEVGKSYNIVVSATVNGVAGNAVIASFTLTSPQFSSAAAALSTATVIKSTRTETTADYWKRALITFRTGALAGQIDRVASYAWDGTNGNFTVQTGFTGAPANGDEFDIVVE